jgi:glycerol-3-phosphate dehydrogenase subunit C
MGSERVNRTGCSGCSRSAISWQNAEYLEEASLDDELRRVFEVCRTCRRCEMLCESFPRLFDQIDNSATGQLDAVSSLSFKSVADACTLCDMCYPVCPYVPPHDYALDFPSLMIRYRAVEKRNGSIGFFEREFAKIDRNSRVMGLVAPLVNWATKRNNYIARVLVEKVAGVHRDSALPCFHASTFSVRAKVDAAVEAPAEGRRVVIYDNCLVEYNVQEIGAAARTVLARNGIRAEVVYPGCCGMPALERGDVAGVCKQAKIIADALVEWIDRGYDIVTLVPSCSFMVKDTWPLYLPDNPNIARLADNTFDICEYIVSVARADGLVDGLKPLDGGVALHIACHARAQAMGPKAAVMLRMIPEVDVLMMERCSGHGGTWGMMKDNFDVGMKVGRDLIEQAASSGRRYLASECPLAGLQIVQGMESFPDGSKPRPKSYHPIELLAMSYGDAR